MAESLGGKVTSDLDIGAINNNILSGINSLYNQIIALINSNLSPELQETEFNRLRYNYRHSFNETPVSTKQAEQFVEQVVEQLPEQEVPATIRVKPVLDPQEFADEITEQLIGHNTQIGVEPKVDDPNLFVGETTNQLKSWNVNVDVQPQIDWPSKFAETVSEQIQYSPAQIPVEPLPEGEFDSERFAQQVTNRLIGETAKINVDLSGKTDNKYINNESNELNGLGDVLDDITRKVGQKTAAFVNEKGEVDKAVNIEKTRLNELKDVVDGVTKSVNEKTQAFKNEAKAINTAINAEQKAEKNQVKKKKKETVSKEEKEQRKIWDKYYEDAYKANYLFDQKRKKDDENRSKQENENRLQQLEEYKNKFEKIDIDKYPSVIKETINSLDTLLKSFDGANFISSDDLNNIKELFDVIDDSEKLASKSSVSNLIYKIQTYLKKNSKIPKETRLELEALIDRLQQMDVLKSDVGEVNSAFKDMASEISAAGKEGKNFLEIFKTRVIYTFAQQIASLFSFQDIIRYVRTAVTTIRQLDTALVDLRKTTTMSSSELDRFYKSSNAIAKRMGVTTEEIINQASAWSRLGYSSADAAETMAELSSQFAAISPGMDVNQATDGLVSSMKAFGIEVSDVERKISDNINRIGNTAATSNQEIVDMLTRSSAAMATANNTIEETIALETAAVEITRNAETTGTAFKTLAMRIRGYDEETEELSDDLKNIAGDIADLTKINGKGGVSLFTDETKETYKSTYQILKEISEIWDQLSDKNQAEFCLCA